MSSNFRLLAIVPALAGVVVAGEQSPKAVVTKATSCECQAVVVAAGRPTLAERRADRRAAKGPRCNGAECATRTVEVTETPAIIRTESVYETRKVSQKKTINPTK